MKFRISFVVLVVLLMALSACAPAASPSATPSVEGYPTLGSPSMEGYAAPQNSSSEVPSGSVPAPVPDEGKASLSGILYQKSHSAVLTNFFIYLTPAQGDNRDQPPPILAGPLADKGDIAAKTNEKGEFAFNNLTPGNYFLVVNLGYDYELAVKSMDDMTPMLIQLTPNQQLSLGAVVVP
jgi:hypothetical protein